MGLHRRHGVHTVGVADVSDQLCRGAILEDKRKHELSVRLELEKRIWEDADLCAKLYLVDAASVTEVLATPAVALAFAELNGTKGCEVAFHAPVCDLYNEVASAVAANISLTKPISFRRAYTVADSSSLQADSSALVDGCHLTPRLVVRMVSSSFSGRGFWSDADIGLEVGREWSELVNQAGIYAQLLFLAHPSRSFVLVICWNISALETRFLFFHRGGIHSTPAMSAKTGQGQIVKAMACAVALQAGLRPWHLDWGADAPALSGVVYHPEVLAMLHTRTALTGRSTHVSVVQLVKQPLESSTGATSTVRGQSDTGPASTRNVPKAVELRPFPGTTPTLSLSVNGVDAAETSHCGTEAYEQAIISYLDRAPLQIVPSLDSEPPSGALVVKDVWGPAGGLNEALLFDTPAFGLPILWAWQSLDRLSTLFDGTATPWPVFDTPPEEDEEDERTAQSFKDLSHLVMYFKTIGKPLNTHARTPRELLEAVFHAMIGHYVLYSQKGVLHRDISAGNILILPTPEERPPPSLEVISDLTLCSGILIDGDLARDVRETEPVDPKAVRGTLPFMSLRVLEAAVTNMPYCHTVADDLESSIWVIVWEYLEHAAARGKLASYMKPWYEGLGSSDPDAMLASKKQIAWDLVSRETPSLRGCPSLSTVVRDYMISSMTTRTPTECYNLYFASIRKALASGDPSLDLRWEVIFASLPNPAG